MNISDMDLRKSTFLDLTSDNEVIEEVIGSSTESNIKGFLTKITDTVRAITFLEYAEFIDNQALFDKVSKEFEDEITLFFNE